MKDLSELFPYIAGVILSLAFAYIPGLKDWYDKQSGKKALIMLGVILVVALGFFGASCVPFLVKYLNITVTCDGAGALAVALAFVKIVIGNQATYLLAAKK